MVASCVFQRRSRALAAPFFLEPGDSRVWGTSLSFLSFLLVRHICLCQVGLIPFVHMHVNRTSIVVQKIIFKDQDPDARSRSRVTLLICICAFRTCELHALFLQLLFSFSSFLFTQEIARFIHGKKRARRRNF